MTPGMRPGTPPPFYELGAIPFQEICRDLLNEEPDIATSDIYGVPGESQDGIDVWAFRRSDSKVEVGQCKCYQDFSAADIRDVTDEFFKYWDSHWSKEGVRRFILFVACDLSKRTCQDEIRRQFKRFQEVGVQYEAWSATTIRNKLRPHPDIVSTYLPPVEYWLQVICGRALTPMPGASEKTSLIVSSMLLSDLEQIANEVSSTKESELERARELLREGFYAEAVAWVRSTKGQQALWSKLAPPIKAKVLRFEASLAINGLGGTKGAQALANEARALSPAEDLTRLNALIAYAEHRASDAIEILRESSTPENRELRAALLIEEGHLAGAWEILEAEEIRSRADGLRLRSLVHLFEGRLEPARREIQQALQLKPRWESTRLTAATIDYYSALSPSALSGSRLWPAPIPWKLVQRDDESLARLRKSAQVFNELLANASPNTERSTLETWYLACVLNDAEHQEAAVAFCKQLLERSPGHVGAILWANARNLEVDLEPSIAELERRVTEGRADLPEILALTNVYLSRNQAGPALKLLEKTRSSFEKQNASHAWQFWRAQSLIDAGNFEEAIRVAEQLHQHPLATNIKLSVLNRRKHTDEGLEQFVKFLEECSASTGDLTYLLEACTAMARQGKWAYVADRAEALVASIGTMDALHLAVTCTYNAKRFEQCLTLLNKHRNLLPHARLTGELRRIRAECHQHLGGLPEALRECETLVREEPSLENHLRLASTLVSAGDLDRLAVTAREIERHPDLTASHALQLASTLLPYNSERSVELVHRAVELGVHDDEVGPTLFLALQLGLKGIAREFSLRMHALAQKGSGHFRSIEISEIHAQQLAFRKRAEHLEELYRKGELPIHMYAAWAKRPLADLYHGLLSRNEAQPNPDRQPSLLIRSGRRPLPAFSEVRPDWKLWLDVTAILLAAHLDILDEVERAFKPLWIPPSLIHALIEMRAAMEHSQPSRLRAQRKIVDLATRGTLKLAQNKLPTEHFEPALEQELGARWLRLFEQAQSKNGYLVDFLPVRKITLDLGLATLPDGAKHVVASCWSVLEALRHLGAISEASHRTALDALGTLGERDEGTVPHAGRPLFFRQGVLDQLIEVGVIDGLLAHFDVYIEASALESAQEELQNDSRQQEAGRWLDALVSRIRRGLENKTYWRLPMPVVDHDSTSEEEHHVGLVVDCLTELIKLKPPAGTAVWIDDRCMHAYSGVGQASIVGVVEVLNTLVGAKTLTSERYFEVLSRLRAANAWFIPLTELELLHALRHARVHQGRVLETRELVSLRRSFSASLSKSSMLQAPAKVGGTGELAFVLESSKAIRDAIFSLWKSTSDKEAERARADWLFHEMHFGVSGAARSIGLGLSARDEALLEISDALSLIVRALDLPVSVKEEVSTRKQYFGWLSRRLLFNLWSKEPSSVSDMAAQIKLRMHEALSMRTSDEDRKIAAVHFSCFIDDLPEPLREEVDRDEQFLATMGRRIIAVISVMGRQFTDNQFWSAAEQAVNGREVSVTTVDDQTVAVKPGSSSQQGPSIVLCIPGEKPVLLEEFVLGGLLLHPEERKAFLEKYRLLLDSPESLVQQVCDESFSQLSPVERVRRFTSISNSNAGLLYAKLHSQLSELGRFTFSELLPIAGETLLRHHGLSLSVEDSNTTFAATLEVAAATLVREVGVEAALLRLAALPVPLPAAITRSFDELPSDARRKLFHTLTRVGGSPVFRWHLIRLLWAYRSEHAPYGRCALSLSARVLRGRDAEEFDFFTALLSWTWIMLRNQKDAERYSPQLKLALIWAHAHHLAHVFNTEGADYERLRELFKGESVLGASYLVGKSSAEQLDAMHPHRINRLSFTLSCLSYALGNATSSELGVVHGLALDFAFPEKTSEGVLVPHLELLHDVSLAQNCLDSFLGGDRGGLLASLFSAEQVALLRKEALEQLCAHALENLKAGKEVRVNWGMLGRITGGLPIYPGLKPELEELISSLEIVPTLEQDLRLGLLVLQSACAQSRSLNQEARRHLIEQWKATVSFLSRQEAAGDDGQFSKEDAAQLVTQLIGTLLSVIDVTPAGENFIPELSKSLSHLALVPSFRATSTFKLALERIYLGLPLSARADLWPILMNIRSAHPARLPTDA